MQLCSSSQSPLWIENRPHVTEYNTLAEPAAFLSCGERGDVWIFFISSERQRWHDLRSLHLSLCYHIIESDLSGSGAIYVTLSVYRIWWQVADPADKPVAPDISGEIAIKISKLSAAPDPFYRFVRSFVFRASSALTRGGPGWRLIFLYLSKHPSGSVSHWDLRCCLIRDAQWICHFHLVRAADVPQATHTVPRSSWEDTIWYL